MNCQDRRNLMPLYLAGGLEPAEEADLRAHLATGCAACAAALTEAQELLAQIPLALDPATPSAGALGTLMSRVAADSSRDALSSAALLAAPRPSIPLAEGKKPDAPSADVRWSWAIYGAIAAGLLVGISMYLINYNQRQTYLSIMAEQNGRLTKIQEATGLMITQFHRMESNYQTLQTDYAALKEQSQQSQNRITQLTAALDARELKFYEIPGTPKQPEAKGFIAHDVAAARYYFIASGLKPLPAGKVYELWLIDDKNTVASGIFTVGPDGIGRLTATPATPITPTTFAITDERAPGVPKAEGEIQMLGKVPEKPQI